MEQVQKTVSAQTLGCFNAFLDRGKTGMATQVRQNPVPGLLGQPVNLGAQLLYLVEPCGSG